MRRLFVVLLCGVLAAAFLAAKGQSAEPSFSVHISAPQTVKAGSRIEVTIVFTNTSNHDIKFTNHMPGYLNYGMKVLNDKGEPVPLTAFGRLVFTGTCGTKDGKRDDDPNDLPCMESKAEQSFIITVKAGESTQEQLVLNYMFRLRQPGKYSIQFSQADDLASGNPKPTAQSNTIAVTITP